MATAMISNTLWLEHRAGLSDALFILNLVAYPAAPAVAPWD